MEFKEQDLGGVYLTKRAPNEDTRGSFSRLFCNEKLAKVGVDFKIDQINLSVNLKRHTLRGFHVQKKPHSESKIITILRGSIFNVVLDLRKDSKTFLKWKSFTLSEFSLHGLIVPTGCANAFLTLEDGTEVLYFMQGSFHAESGFGIRYDDPLFSIPWPFEAKIISDKDRAIPNFNSQTWEE